MGAMLFFDAISHGVLFVSEKFANFVVSGDVFTRQTYYESVFRGLSKKMWQFSTKQRRTNSTHFLYMYGLWHILCLCPALQVWGIASFICFGFATTFLEINENQLHTFYL